jgi:hypothetical protein
MWPAIMIAAGIAGGGAAFAYAAERWECRASKAQTDAREAYWRACARRSELSYPIPEGETK